MNYWRHTLRAAPICIALSLLVLEIGYAADWSTSNHQVPTVRLPGIAHEVTLPSEGRVVYVDFWASWCGPCRTSFPWMNTMQEKYREQGLEVIAINLDEQRADADRFLAMMSNKLVVAFDPAGITPQKFGVKGMPTSFIIGRDGRFRYLHTGFQLKDAALLEEKIKEALAQP